jgi:ribosomal protein S18 acetylase RimI-like enzyme
MNPNLHIRKATPADITAIRQIAHTTWPVAYGKLLSAEQLSYMLGMMYSETSLQQQFDKGDVFYLALLDNEPVGFASVTDEHNGRFKLNKLYVLPTIQKSGAGKALLEAAKTHATQNNGTELYLQVKRDNPAKTFYEKIGFTVTGEIDLDIGNGYLMQDYLMTLIIN